MAVPSFDPSLKVPSENKANTFDSSSTEYPLPNTEVQELI